jgi:RND family efflux transporter MFP subunit
MIAFVCSAAVAGCKHEETPTKAEKPVAAASENAATVRFAKIEVRRVPPVLELTGTLDPRERSEVAAQTAGVVSKLLVDVGTRVKKGDVLVVLDSSEAALRLAAAQATAEQQKARLGIKAGEKFDVARVADVRSAREARDLRVKEAERAKALAKQGSISEASLDQATSAAEQSEAQLDAARNGAEQAWAALNAANAQARLSSKALRDTRVLAPFDGAIAERRVSTGEFAQVGRVIAVVVADDPLRLRLDVSEADVASVTVGKEVRLRVAAYPGREFHGSIGRIGASLNPASRTLSVEADLPNSDGLLRPGFFATASVTLSGAPADAFFVPKAALGTAGNSSRVFVRAGNRVLEKIVMKGREMGELVEVRGPLSAGDEVAVEKVSELGDSQPIVAR